MTPVEKLQLKINEENAKAIYFRDLSDTLHKMVVAFDAMTKFFEDHEIPAQQWPDLGYAAGNHSMVVTIHAAAVRDLEATRAVVSDLLAQQKVAETEEKVALKQSADAVEGGKKLFAKTLAASTVQPNECETWDQISQTARDNWIEAYLRNELHAKIEAHAKHLYGRYTCNQPMHGNRFPNWEEMTDYAKKEWRDKARKDYE